MSQLINKSEPYYLLITQHSIVEHKTHRRRNFCILGLCVGNFSEVANGNFQYQKHLTQIQLEQHLLLNKFFLSLTCRKIIGKNFCQATTAANIGKQDCSTITF